MYLYTRAHRACRWNRWNKTIIHIWHKISTSRAVPSVHNKCHDTPTIISRSGPLTPFSHDAGILVYDAIIVVVDRESPVLVLAILNIDTPEPILPRMRSHDDCVYYFLLFFHLLNRLATRNKDVPHNDVAQLCWDISHLTHLAHIKDPCLCWKNLGCSIF
jgi:hypothetical protein